MIPKPYILLTKTLQFPGVAEGETVSLSPEAARYLVMAGIVTEAGPDPAPQKRKGK